MLPYAENMKRTEIFPFELSMNVNTFSLTVELFGIQINTLDQYRYLVKTRIATSCKVLFRWLYIKVTCIRWRNFQVHVYENNKLTIRWLIWVSSQFNATLNIFQKIFMLCEHKHVNTIICTIIITNLENSLTKTLSGFNSSS